MRQLPQNTRPWGALGRPRYIFQKTENCQKTGNRKRKIVVYIQSGPDRLLAASHFWALVKHWVLYRFAGVYKYLPLRDNHNRFRLKILLLADSCFIACKCDIRRVVTTTDVLGSELEDWPEQYRAARGKCKTWTSACIFVFFCATILT